MYKNAVCVVPDQDSRHAKMSITMSVGQISILCPAKLGISDLWYYTMEQILHTVLPYNMY